MQHKMLKRLNIHFYLYHAKKQFYHMNCVRVLTVKREFGVRFLVTGACQNTQANLYLLSICNRCSVPLLFWRLGKAPFDCTALKILSGPSLGYDLSFGTSLAKVGGLGVENNSCKKTDTAQSYI